MNTNVDFDHVRRRWLGGVTRTRIPDTIMNTCTSTSTPGIALGPTQRAKAQLQTYWVRSAPRHSCKLTGYSTDGQRCVLNIHNTLCTSKIQYTGEYAFLGNTVGTVAWLFIRGRHIFIYNPHSEALSLLEYLSLGCLHMQCLSS